MTKGDKAKELFEKGYNCSQSVVGAFAPDLGLDCDMAFKIASGYGGGMGRLREVCGTFSGIVMVMSLMYGYDNPNDREGKVELYKRIQTVGTKFRELNGSLICKELLGIAVIGGSPEERSKKYYKKRPCSEICKVAGDILEEYIAENK